MEGSGAIWQAARLRRGVVLSKREKWTLGGISGEVIAAGEIRLEHAHRKHDGEAQEQKSCHGPCVSMRDQTRIWEVTLSSNIALP